MLRSPISELSLFYDLEWVPDAAGAKRLYDLSDDVSELDAMSELWKRAPKFDAEKDPRPFLKYMYSRVVSIAFLSRKTVYNSDREKIVEFGLNSLPKLPLAEGYIDEGELIQQFLYFVGKRRPQLVGYNSSESDLQVLIQRGLINEISAPEFCSRPTKNYDPGDYFKRWDNEEHLDLAKQFSGGAMMPRLDEMAKLCGFPGKIDVKGDQVTDLWLAGDVTKIVEYNQIDTLNTYLVWLRLVHFAGKIEEEEYQNEQDAFREFLETETQKPEKAFISEFLDKWPL